MAKKLKWRCTECKGKNVEIRAWVNPNDLKQIDFIEDGGNDDNWCNDCDDHTELEIV